MAIKFSWSRRAEADGLDRADPGPRQNGGSGRVLPKRRAAPLETVADRREAVEQRKAAAPFRRGGGTRRMEPGARGRRAGFRMRLRRSRGLPVAPSRHPVWR